MQCSHSKNMTDFCIELGVEEIVCGIHFAEGVAEEGLSGGSFSRVTATVRPDRNHEQKKRGGRTQ